MAKFDVYRSSEGGYWLDCQANLLSSINSRFVVPLLATDRVGQINARLNPVVQVGGVDHYMMTHFAAAIPASLLRQPVASLVSAEYEIGAALDLLISGF